MKFEFLVGTERIHTTRSTPNNSNKEWRKKTILVSYNLLSRFYYSVSCFETNKRRKKNVNVNCMFELLLAHQLGISLVMLTLLRMNAFVYLLLCVDFHPRFFRFQHSRPTMKNKCKNAACNINRRKKIVISKFIRIRLTNLDFIYDFLVSFSCFLSV